MDFSAIEGLDEFFSDGVLDPSLGNAEYRLHSKKYKELAHRVFVLYEPDPNEKTSVFTGNSTRSGDDGKENSSAAEFDVVFVHGIGSDEFKCWTNEKGVLWPAAFLPQDFPSARVLTVGYAHALWNWKGSPKQVEKAPEEEETGSGCTVGTPAMLPAAATTLEADSGGSGERCLSRADAEGDSGSSSTAATPSSPLDTVWNRLPGIETLWGSFWEGDSRTRKEDLRGNSLGLASPSSTVTVEAAAKQAGAALASSSPAEAVALSSTKTSERVFSRSALCNLLMRSSETRSDMPGATESPERTAAVGVDLEKGGARQMQSFRLVAADIADRLVKAGVGTGERPVVFIVHSMGGLIVKQMVVSLFQLISLVPRREYLRTAVETDAGGDEAKGREATHAAALVEADVFLRSLRGVVFYGTPHFGSGLASVITGLQRYYSNLGGLTPTHVVTGLGDHNRGALTVLNDSFMEVVGHLDEQSEVDFMGPESKPQRHSAAFAMLTAPSVGISILSFGETKRLNGVLRVVEPESANPAPDNPRFPFHLLDGDHSQINRPEAKTSPGYAVLYGFLDRLQQRGLLVPPHGMRGLLADSADPLDGAESAVAAAEGVERRQCRPRGSESEKLEAFERGAWELLRHGVLTKVGGGSQAKEPALVAYNEALLVIRSLEETQMALQETLRHFFGRATPPQLNGVFLLGADISEFLSRGICLLKCREEELANAQHSGENLAAHCDFTKSFLIPARLLLYWSQHAINMVRGFEQSQLEATTLQTAAQFNHSAQASLCFSSLPSGTLGGAGAVAHLPPRAVRQMEAFEDNVGILQGEWEGFRRYLSVAIRQELRRSPISKADVTAARHDRSPLGAVGNERIAVLFFTRAVRCLVAHALRDGQCLSNLVGHFINHSLELVLSADHLREANEGGKLSRSGGGAFLGVSSPGKLAVSPLPVQGSRAERQVDRLAGFTERDAFAAWLAESLELCSGGDQQQSVGSQESEGLPLNRNQAAARKAEPQGHQLLEVLPPLNAAASFLLACYHLLLNELPARTAAACVLFDAAQASLEDYRRTFLRLEQAERTSARRKGGGERGSPFWWRGGGSSVDPRRRSKKASSNSDDSEKGDVWQRIRILTEAFNLLSHSLKCVAYLRELDTKVPSTSPHDKEEVRSLVKALAESTNKARTAYARAECALDARQDDIARPFVPPQTESGVTADSDRNEGQEALPDKGRESARGADGAEGAKKAFRDALAEIVKELDGVIGNPKYPQMKHEGRIGGELSREVAESKASTRKDKLETTLARFPRSSSSAPWHAARTKWPTAASSLPKLVINSVLNAWEAVRRGREIPETPQYFACNVFVFWWSVERYAEWVERVMARNVSTVGNRAQPVAAGQGHRAPSHCRTAVMELSPDGGCHQERVSGDSSAVAAGGSVPTLTHCTVKSEELRRSKHFTQANPRIRCQWLTASSYVDVIEARQRHVAAMRTEVRGMITPGGGCGGESPSIEPVAVSRRVGSLLKEMRTPIRDLGDAVHLDNTNPLAKCVLGHWYFLNQRSSSNAAHAYAQAMKLESDPLSGLFQTAAVGLGWAHLHRLTATVEVTGHSAAKHDPIWEGLANEQGLRAATRPEGSGPLTFPFSGGADGVLDPLALWAGPEGFVEFCGEAKRLLAFSSSFGQGAARGVLASPSNAVMQHLMLADAYFHNVLEADPNNVGALCGIGRIRSLVPSAGTGVLSNVHGRRCLSGGGFCIDTDATERLCRRLSSSSAVVPLNARVVTAYLEAATRASESVLHEAPLTVKSVLGPVFGSYAAYWMGNITGPAGALKASGSPQGSSPSSSSSTSSLAVQRQVAALARSQQWYTRAVELDPFNDWALTSLGLSYFQQHALVRAGVSHATQGAVPSSATARGLGLLETALQVNPTNQWALWGIVAFAADTKRRNECFQLLRRCVTTRSIVGLV